MQDGPVQERYQSSDDLCLHFIVVLMSSGQIFRPTVSLVQQDSSLKMKFMNHARLALLRANLPADKYAGQIGVAIKVVPAGIEDSTILNLGNW